MKYRSVKTGNLLHRSPDQFYWKGEWFHGLVDIKTNALYDDPEDSFNAHVGIPTAFEEGLIMRVLSNGRNMDAAQLVNLIIKKFGGNRVEFNEISEDDTEVLQVRFVLGGNTYLAFFGEHDYTRTKGILVRRYENNDMMQRLEDNYSRWVEGILNNKVRNEEGVLL